MTRCFFAAEGPCAGRIDRMHLIPKQLLKREFRHGAVLVRIGGWEEWQPFDPRVSYDLIGGVLARRSLEELQGDPRTFVAGCRIHHGAFDVARTVRLARADLPPVVEEFAGELGLGWWLDREYGERKAAV